MIQLPIKCEIYPFNTFNLDEVIKKKSIIKTLLIIYVEC